MRCIACTIPTTVSQYPIYVPPSQGYIPQMGHITHSFRVPPESLLCILEFELIRALSAQRVNLYLGPLERRALAVNNPAHIVAKTRSVKFQSRPPSGRLTGKNMLRGAKNPHSALKKPHTRVRTVTLTSWLPTSPCSTAMSAREVFLRFRAFAMEALVNDSGIMKHIRHM